ncbi:MAG: ComF family protein [Anaerolineales bacterium]|nr:ComF family protein [Anaerolineales bacterium]
MGTYRLYAWFWAGLDWLYPPVCGGCGRAGSRWCSQCQEQVSPVAEPICGICGLPTDRMGLCENCRLTPPPFLALRSWAVFEGPIRSALHRLKYRRNLALGDVLAQPMADYCRRLDWPVEVVVPVPLGSRRLQERGYNQVELIAMPLAALNGWQYAPRSLSRTRETKSQIGLSAAERQENMEGAFRADPRRVADRTLLLMDDVATTGATLSAGAEALLSSGAKAVYALTLARALPRHGLQHV